MTDDQEPDLEERLRRLAMRARSEEKKHKKIRWPYLVVGAIGLISGMTLMYELDHKPQKAMLVYNNTIIRKVVNWTKLHEFDHFRRY